ncbi:hypothetical protein B0H67DRAFT_298216 [Lasiosphaeris hirsuta]|uniref:Secreted protein n=1 Tax=Lasiosphaeris hirsuta TaxID=260670 RepID=A0AA40A9M5_9PEZI|nr:hypothetical protein B0H67DRAFT_298216 [Lasiosphaeris hirsuta]
MRWQLCGKPPLLVCLGATATLTGQVQKQDKLADSQPSLLHRHYTMQCAYTWQHAARYAAPSSRLQCSCLQTAIRTSVSACVCTRLTIEPRGMA